LVTDSFGKKCPSTYVKTHNLCAKAVRDDLTHDQKEQCENFMSLLPPDKYQEFNDNQAVFLNDDTISVSFGYGNDWVEGTNGITKATVEANKEALIARTREAIEATGRKMEIVEGVGDIEIVFSGKSRSPNALAAQRNKMWWHKTPNGSQKSRVNLYLDKWNLGANGSIMNADAKLEDVCQHEVIHALGLGSHTETTDEANYSIMTVFASWFGLKTLPRFDRQLLGAMYTQVQKCMS